MQLYKNINILSKLKLNKTRVISSISSLLSSSSHYEIPKVNLNDNISNAINCLVHSTQPAIAVVEKDKLVGMFTEKDYINKILRQGYSTNNENIKIKDVATLGNELFIVKDNDSLEHCMEIMVEKNIPYLAITDKSDKPIGILSINEIARKINQNKNKNKSSWIKNTSSALIDSVDYFTEPYDNPGVIENKYEAEQLIENMKSKTKSLFQTQSTPEIIDSNEYFTEPYDNPGTIEFKNEVEQLIQTMKTKPQFKSTPELIDSNEYFTEPYDCPGTIEFKNEAENIIENMKKLKPKSTTKQPWLLDTDKFTEPSDAPETIDNLSEAKYLLDEKKL